jgi:hypothetical protein
MVTAVTSPPFGPSLPRRTRAPWGAHGTHLRGVIGHLADSAARPVSALILGAGVGRRMLTTALPSVGAMTGPLEVFRARVRC